MRLLRAGLQRDLAEAGRHVEAGHAFDADRLQGDLLVAAADQDVGAEAEARIAWVSQARCRQADPDELFVRGAAQRKAAVICRHCPVILECGADALDNRVEFGVWGGMTEDEREAHHNGRPSVAEAS